MSTLRRRAFVGLALAALLAAIGVWSSTGVAHAAITSFSMTPKAGPPGTLVHVNGTGCSPGLLASAGTDFVTLTATTLNLAFRVPVASNGSWQGSFTVPSGAIGVPAAVTAVCVSSGLQSLATIYTPQTFSATAPILPALPTLPVLGNPTSTTPDSPTTGSPGTTAPTTPDDRGGPKPTTGPGATVGTPDPGAGTPDPGAGTGGSPPGGSVTIGTAESIANGRQPAANEAGTNRARTVGAATLEPATLGSSIASDGAGGLGWLGWLLLVALALGAVGVPAWLWHSHGQNETPEAVGESG